MGIRQDYEALQKSWAEFSPLTKVFLGASFAVTSLSIASLAETVTKFKGFIVTAVLFYRRVTWPLAHLLALRQITVDAYVLCLVTLGAQVRASFEAKDSLTRLSPGEVRLIALLVTAVTIVTLVAQSADNETRSALTVFVSTGIILLWDIVRGFGGDGNTSFQRRLLWLVGIEADAKKRLQSRLQLSYIGAAILVVAVLAAISDGLTRVSKP